MKFLADMGVSLKTVNDLRNAAHDTVHLRDIGWQKKPDKEIKTTAKRGGLTTVTASKAVGYWIMPL